MQEPPPPEIRWFTTAYVTAEDRLRLACSLTSGGSEILWLTQRLANALVKQLVGWLDKVSVQDRQVAGIAHRMAQQAAVAKAPKKAPERIPDAPGWLLHSVRVNTNPKGVVLTFKGEGERSVFIRFATDHLRQWLRVLHVQYRRSGWPLDVWPDWMNEEAEAEAPAHSGLLH